MAQPPLVNGLDKWAYLLTLSVMLRSVKQSGDLQGLGPWTTLWEREQEGGGVIKWGRNKEGESSLMTLPGKWKWNIRYTLFYVLSFPLISLFLFSSLSLPFFSSLCFCPPGTLLTVNPPEFYAHRQEIMVVDKCIHRCTVGFTYKVILQSEHKFKYQITKNFNMMTAEL